jgi:hypothetical protein
MFKSAYFLLLVCAIAPFVVEAIPPRACKAGTGLIDPSKDPFTNDPNPADCKPCAVKGCIDW